MFMHSPIKCSPFVTFALTDNRKNKPVPDSGIHFTRLLNLHDAVHSDDVIYEILVFQPAFRLIL